MPLVLHDQTKITLLLVIVCAPSTDYTHACMDRLKQRVRQIRVFDGVTNWDDFDNAPGTRLPLDFKML